MVVGFTQPYTYFVYYETFYHSTVPAQPALQPAGEQRRGRGGLGPPGVLEGEALARGPLQPLRIGRGRFASLRGE